MTLPIMLFAAGKGTRMGPLTENQPKPLVKVTGKPLIDYALDIAHGARATPVVVNLHYKAEMLRAHLSSANVVFSDETDTLLETGGGLSRALPLLDASPVLTMNTDAVWQGPNPVQALLDQWQPHMEALLLLVEKANVCGHLGSGDFSLGPSDKIKRAPDKVYTGVQIIRTQVLAEINETAFSMNIVWDIIARRGGLYGAIYSGKWCDVGQPESIPLAEGMLRV